MRLWPSIWMGAFLMGHLIILLILYVLIFFVSHMVFLLLKIHYLHSNSPSSFILNTQLKCPFITGAFLISWCELYVFPLLFFPIPHVIMSINICHFNLSIFLHKTRSLMEVFLVKNSW